MDLLRQHSRRVRPLTALAFAGVLSGMIAGCGDRALGEREGSDADAVAARARQVAEAWDGSSAAEAWRAGLHPMSDVTQPPRGGFHSAADERAYRHKNFVLRTQLPTRWPKTGQVVWPDGGKLSRPLVDPRKAFESMSSAPPAGEPPLTVTGVKFATMTITTGRGPTTVPAWAFSVKGYESPVKRAAAEPSGLPDRPPVRGTADVPVDKVHHLVRMDPRERTVSVVTVHGACEESSAVDVLETKGSVVLSATAVNRRGDGLCTKQAELRQVTVRLDRPLGERLLLDAHTGLPVPYRPENGPSPSWS
ncbi:hypothetical protein GTW43_20095 [Streptomyces sp. SID5785]|uniref:hypothetical protein n=1 Tax=Streptomyces sp. SID5785 TaxID=2690309 RepID=UPI001360C602|nr:hypothetical protein [Streptomyces sp. SID5785]MZD07365.1 hypothetical protein [Streptomyces sp. SID5785]